MALNYVDLTCAFNDTGGNPASGTVTAVPTSVVLNASGSIVIGAEPQSRTLSGAGSAVLHLVASDNSGLVPSSGQWAYSITVNLTGAPSFTNLYLINFANGSAQNLSALSPVVAFTAYASTGAGGGGVTFPITIVEGGTGATTQQAGMDALAGAVTTGQYLRGNGTHVTMSAIQVTDVPDQPWQFRPESYGAKGDGKMFLGAATTATGTTLTDTTNNPFTSADVGKVIVVNQGAFNSNTNPYTGTIAGFTDSGHVTVSPAFGSTSTNAPYIYGTDDAAAINSCVSAANTAAPASNYHVQILFKNKFYMLGALTQVTTPNKYNTHIPVPVGPQLAQKLIIDFVGTGDASGPQFWESELPDVRGSCLVSAVRATGQPDATFGQMSVIGGPTAVSANMQPGNIANTALNVSGITIVCPWNAQQFGVYADLMTQLNLPSASYQAFAPVNLSNANVSGPQLISTNLVPNGVSVGFSFPTWLNNDNCNVGWGAAAGPAIGFRIAEHFYAAKLAVFAAGSAGIDCGNLTAGAHGAVIGYYSCEQSAYAIQALNDAGSPLYPVNIGQMDLETMTTGHINDPSSQMAGIIRYANFTAGHPVVTGGQQLILIDDSTHVPGPWAGAPAAPASGGASANTQQNTAYRYATIYASATTSITNVWTGPPNLSSGLTATGLAGGANVVVPVRVQPGGYWSIAFTGTLTAKWVLD